MKIRFVAVLLVALSFVGAADWQAADVSHQIATDAPRPIFESAADLQRLSLPCTHIQHARFDAPITAQNTRCTKADRRDE